MPFYRALKNAFFAIRAGDEARTRDLQLGRLSLYQLSYFRVFDRQCGDCLKELSFINLHKPGSKPGQCFVGKDGFEPPNSEEDRFTVCCRWPLGYLPGISIRKSQRRDSNPRPADYKSAALPTELRWHFCEKPIFQYDFR